MEIDKQLYEEIKEFCKLNGIKDVRGQIHTCLRHGFNILKYGDNPFSYHNPMDENNSAKEEKTSDAKEHGQHTNIIGENSKDITSEDNGMGESSTQKESVNIYVDEAIIEEKKKPKRKVRIIKN